MILESFLPILFSFIVISFVDRADVYLSSFAQVIGVMEQCIIFYRFFGG